MTIFVLIHHPDLVPSDYHLCCSLQNSLNEKYRRYKNSPRSIFFMNKPKTFWKRASLICPIVEKNDTYICTNLVTDPMFYLLKRNNILNSIQTLRLIPVEWKWIIYKRTSKPCMIDTTKTLFVVTYVNCYIFFKYTFRFSCDGLIKVRQAWFL